MPDFFEKGRFLARLFGAWVLVMSTAAAAANSNPILVGLDADMSLGSARAGEAIRRGIELAIDEINARGGVLGRPLDLVVRDHRGNPARGEDNIREFAAVEDLVAVVGGLHTPVALQELKAIHETQVIYLGPWAAGTAIVENGYHPNFVFRVSVRDEFAGGFLVREALTRGYTRIALALENTGWGRSNERAIKQALDVKGVAPVATSWFHWGTVDFSELLNDLLKGEPDAILMVANAPEGLKIVQEMAARPQARRVQIISHWGITGGQFFEEAGASLKKVDLLFLQTYSFIAPTSPDRARPLVDAYKRRYKATRGAADISSPVGTAHAYDLVLLLARAIEKAGSTDRQKVRDAMEDLGDIAGLVRDYRPPFTTTRHDALDDSNFFLARYRDDGVIVPVN